MRRARWFGQGSGYLSDPSSTPPVLGLLSIEWHTERNPARLGL